MATPKEVLDMSMQVAKHNGHTMTEWEGTDGKRQAQCTACHMELHVEYIASHNYKVGGDAWQYVCPKERADRKHTLSDEKIHTLHDLGFTRFEP